MADGSIIFSTALDNAQLEKDLAALNKRIVKKEQDIAKLRSQLDAGREKGLFDAAALDAEKAKLEGLKTQLKEIRAVAGDKTYSAGAREQARADIPAAQEELRDQQVRVNALQAEYNRLYSSTERYERQLAEAESELSRQKETAGGLVQEIEASAERARELRENAAVSDQGIVDLRMELEQLQAKLEQLRGAGLGLGHEEYDQTAARIAEINKQLREYQRELAQSTDRTDEKAGAADRMAGALVRAEGYMHKFTRRIAKLAGRVFVFTLITSALRSVRSYLWGSIKASNQATQAIAKLKGAFLTLAQPLIEVIIPAFTVLINVLARVVTAAAQLISMLFGKTLKQSNDNAKALYEETKAIKGVGSAADEAAGSLAGFDEINTLSTDTGGAGGGAETGIAPDFDLSFSDGIFDKLKEIADLVLLIGTGFALWRIGQSVPGILGAIMSSLGLILMALGGILVFWDGLTDAWENGVDWANLIEMIGGLAAAAFGLYQLLGPLAAGIALIVGGLAMLVTGFHDAFENGWNLQNTLLSMAGLFSTGLGISLVTGTWIPALLGGIAAVLLAITVATGHGEELLEGVRTMMGGFLDFFTGIFTGDFDRAVQGLIQIFSGLETAAGAVLDGIRDFIGLFLDWLDEKTGGRLSWIIETVRTMVSGLIDGIKQMLSGLVEFLTGIFTGNLEMVISGIRTMIDGLKTAVFAIIEGIQGVITGFLDWLDNATNGRFHGVIEAAKGFVTGFFKTVKKVLGDLLDAVETIFGGIIKFITGAFTGDWEMAWEGVKDIFKGIWNGIVSLVESAINFIIRGINAFIGALNRLKLPDWVPVVGGMGVNISPIPEAKIPRLAQGAVIPPNREFMAVLGDQGHGNNLEAPESLIRKIVREESGGGRETNALLQAILEAVRAGHVIMVDRRVLGKTVTQEQNRMTRQSGTSVVLG